MGRMLKTSVGALFMFLWLHLDWVSGGENVVQRPASLSVQEGNGCDMNCSYSDSGSDYFPWYKQEAGKGPQLIIYIRSYQDKTEDGRFTVSLNKSAKQLSLHIEATQLGDSAVYFCAASDPGGTRLFFGTGTQLVVKPNIQNATPAVYQLENRKSNTPICLFTDFDSNINVSDVLNDTVISSKNTVVDMKATNSKSNGVLFWSNTAKSGCEGISEEITYYTSEGIPCDAKLIEKGFETDMNLNSQNLSVIALRILLLKVVGFNLLMTLRLWSS